MEQTSILHADYLDIIYDNHNKRYGSYELRLHYDQRIRKAMLFLLLSVAAFICFSFAVANHKGSEHINTAIVAPTLIDVTPIPKPEPKVIREVTPPPPAPAHLKTKLFTEPVIDPNDHVPDNKQMTQNKDLANVHVGTTIQDGDSLEISIESTKKTGTGLAEIPKPTEPVKWVEQMPQFSGDMTAYISSHLTYPDAARENNIDGTVLIQFVVNEDGAVSNATIIRSVGGGCDQEALRMVNGMPKWKPGKQNGKAVKVYFTLPVKFLLN